MRKCNIRSGSKGLSISIKRTMGMYQSLHSHYVFMKGNYEHLHYFNDS